MAIYINECGELCRHIRSEQRDRCEIASHRLPTNIPKGLDIFQTEYELISKADLLNVNKYFSQPLACELILTDPKFKEQQ